MIEHKALETAYVTATRLAAGDGCHDAGNLCCLLACATVCGLHKTAAEEIKAGRDV